MSTLVFPSMTTPAAPKAPLVQDFPSSGTSTKPAGARLALVELIGGGAGATATGNWTAGRGGSYASHLFAAASLGATEPVTVGAGGVGGSSTATSGGDSIFAGVTARGGKDGSTYGVSPTVGDTTTCSFDGGFGMTGLLANGGLPSKFGAGGGGRDTAPSAGYCLGGTGAAAVGALKAGNGGWGKTGSVGNNGSAPGGGGATNPGGTGGNGAPGAVRITWYF